MSDKDKPPEPEVYTTKSGNKLAVYSDAIRVEGNNNTSIVNSHDFKIGIENQSKKYHKHTSGRVTNTKPKKKLVRRQLLSLCMNYNDGEDFSDEENELLIQKISEIEAMMRKKRGSNLRFISTGSLVITVSVNDTYALENLMESHRSGTFIRELAKIFVTESQIEEFCQTWSTDIDEKMYETVQSKLQMVDKRSTYIMSEWNRSHVREWLSSELHLEDDIVDKFYEEEIIGKNLLVYEADKMLRDFKLKKTDYRMIQYSIEEKKREAALSPRDLLELVADNSSSGRVSELLLRVGLPPIHAEKFTNMGMTGFKFMRYREEHFKEDFHLTVGPLRLVLHLQTLSKETSVSSIVTGISNLSTTLESTVKTISEDTYSVSPSEYRSHNTHKNEVEDVESQEITSTLCKESQSTKPIDSFRSTTPEAEEDDSYDRIDLSGSIEGLNTSEQLRTRTDSTGRTRWSSETSKETQTSSISSIVTGISNLSTTLESTGKKISGNVGDYSVISSEHKSDTHKKGMEDVENLELITTLCEKNKSIKSKSIASFRSTTPKAEEGDSYKKVHLSESIEKLNTSEKLTTVIDCTGLGSKFERFSLSSSASLEENMKEGETKFESNISEVKQKIDNKSKKKTKKRKKKK